MPVTPDHEHRLAPETRVQTLVDWFAKRDGVLVAFSGGVDSSVVAAAAFHALGNRAVACTAISPSVPAWQRDQARQIALEIGIDHREFETREAVLDAYVRNDSRRCFHCKQTLYQAIKVIRDQSNLGGRSWCLVSGTNADDLGDHRPGIQAGRMAGVETPLADLAWNKSHVRAAAMALGLSNAMLPASPCLASRIAYGTEVTPRRLQRIEFAEKLLREAGYDIVRVRLRERDSFD
ncbi:MAG: ATP-dependent sacrificial sulfur transferase LarE, partial [Planctomycetota bacterium]